MTGRPSAYEPLDPGAQEHAAAARIADDAGTALLRLRERHGDPATLRDVADRSAHEQIVGALAAAYPADAVLSEEGRDDLARLDAERVWIVDPLDGTREYGEGRDDWAVHVALWARGWLVAGAVALPGRSEVLATGAPPPVPPASDGRPRLVVSRTRPPAVTAAVQAALDADLVPMGSAGAKIAAVVRGDADVYAHAGGQYEWDSAAPIAVASACGLWCSRLDGSPLRYNARDPYLPDLVVCRPELADVVLAAVDGALPGSW